MHNGYPSHDDDDDNYEKVCVMEAPANEDNELDTLLLLGQVSTSTVIIIIIIINVSVIMIIVNKIIKIMVKSINLSLGTGCERVSGQSNSRL